MSARARRAVGAALVGLVAWVAVSCDGGPQPGEAGSDPQRGGGLGVIRLATTTSTENSGLLTYLLPRFEARYGARVHVLAVGTGRALALGRNGDADLLLVHAPEAERAFVEAGWGLERRTVMVNDFVLLGPPEDPAGAAKAPSAAAALAAVARARCPFVSRGDDSGTHRKERALWAAAGLRPRGPWYLEAGQGMGATLLLADQKRAYCLADRGTYLAMRRSVALAVLLEGDPALDNPYGVVVVNPARCPGVNAEGARALAEWLVSPEGQALIGRFRVDGMVLFRPAAGAGAAAQGRGRP